MTFRRVATLVAAAAALTPVERLYLQHGSRANAFSAAFDSDLERHLTDEGFLAFARHAPTQTSVAFFDPVCDEKHLPAVLDSFVEREKQRGRVSFWKISTETARYLCEAHGFAAAPYGTEHALDVSDAMRRGSRSLRRDVNNARRHARVEVVETYDATLETCERRWLAARPQSRLIRRATRCCCAAPEPYCTKVRAVDAAGATLGWVAFDHCYRDGALVGAGLSTVRWDPHAPKGLPALLAVDGAALVAGDRFRLELGEAPLAPLPRHLAADLPPLPFVSGITRLVYDRGRRLYDARGISAWKRKWRADESALWICCYNDPPLLETAAALALIYDAGARRRPGGVKRGRHRK